MTAAPINFLPKQSRADDELKKVRRWINWFLLLSFLLILGGCMTRAIFLEKPSTDPAAYDPITLEPKEPQGLLQRLKHFVFSKDVNLEGQRDDRINILLLGMGGPGHDGPYLTDTIMIASFKPSTKQVALISVPRDLAVKIPDRGWLKVNHANSIGEEKKAGGGGEFASEVIADTLDLDIPYYGRIDFKAFQEIIDEVGGLTVNVERSFTDYMYPAPGGLYQTVSFTKGIQTMNGTRALIYARSRHGNNNEGSDFARAKRQQKMLLALKEKILSAGTLLNPVRLKKILQSLNTHAATNLTFADLLALIRLGRELNTDRLISLVLDDSENGFLIPTTGQDGAFLLVPKSGHFKAIKRVIENIFAEGEPIVDNTPIQVSAPNYPAVNIEIQNGTWQAGLASRIKKQLADAGLAITTIGNTGERPQAESGIYKVSDADASDVLAVLQIELNLPIKQTAPTSTAAASSTDILIILGEDSGQ